MTYDKDVPVQDWVIETEILIVGSGPVGATYARKLVDAGHQVLMVEIGAQSVILLNCLSLTRANRKNCRETLIPGDHKKNNYIVQKDISSFVK